MWVVHNKKIMTRPHSLFIYGITILFLLSACRYKQKEKNNTEMSEAEEKEYLADSLLNNIKTQSELYKDWTNAYKEKDIHFSLDSFEYLSEYNDEFLNSSFTPDKSFYKKYGPLLVYNADSTKFIDLFSYYLVLNINKNGKVSSGGTEADQEVAVVDKKTKTRYRVFFCGTPCFVAKASWLDNEKIVLFGLTTEDGDDNYTPTIWLIDLKTASTTEYNYNKSINELSPDELLEKILKSKGIK